MSPVLRWLSAFQREVAGRECVRRARVREQLLPGHEALIDRCAADPRVTPGAAAIAVIAAERTRREARAQVEVDALIDRLTSSAKGTRHEH